MICSNPFSFRETLKLALSIQNNFDLSDFDKVKNITIENLNTDKIEINYEIV